MDLKEVQDIVKNMRKTYYHFFSGYGDNMMSNQHFWAMELTDGVVDTMYGHTRMPNNFVEGTSVDIQAVILMGDATGVLRYDFEVEYGADDESWYGNNSAISNHLESVPTALAIWEIPAIELVAGVARGDYIGAKFRREADSAQDTHGVACFGIGFMLSYTGRV